VSTASLDPTTVRRWKRYPEYRAGDSAWLPALPPHWGLKRLKYLGRFVGGGTPAKENLDYWNGDIPWVSPKDMKGPRVSDSEDHITQAGLEGSSTRLVPARSVLIVFRSGIRRHTIPVASIPCRLPSTKTSRLSSYLGWDPDPVSDGWEVHREVFTALEPYSVSG
jgi:hypothetical protein